MNKLDINCLIGMTLISDYQKDCIQFLDSIGKKYGMQNELENQIKKYSKSLAIKVMEKGEDDQTVLFNMFQGKMLTTVFGK